jgi:hypothetical protein
MQADLDIIAKTGRAGADLALDRLSTVVPAWV